MDEEIQEEIRLLKEELQRRLAAVVCPGCREMLDSALECLDGDTADECIESERLQVWDDLDTETLVNIYNHKHVCEQCRKQAGKTLANLS